MSSSGGGDDGGMGMMMLRGQGTPMPGLPVAGQGPGVDPYSYGQFQNFLPDIKAEGPNDMATGLRPDMFNYIKPNASGGTGTTLGGGGGGGGSGNIDGQIQGLRDQLAQLQASGGIGGGRGYGLPQQGLQPLPGQNWYGGPMASS